MLLKTVFEASKLVSTKTLLLKHYYRRQGQSCLCSRAFLLPVFVLCCDPAGHLQECFLGNAQNCSGECFRSAFWGFPESAPESASESVWKIGSVSGSAPGVPFLILSQGKALSGALPGALPIFQALSGALSRALSGNPQKALRKHSPEQF